MGSVYSLEERARARHVVRQVERLREEARDAAQTGQALDELSERQVVALGAPADRSQRITALDQIAGRLQSQHLGRLYALASDDFNAYCEVMTPEEPPESPFHIWLTQTLQDIEYNPELTRFALNVPPGHAKPLSKTEPVLMADGHWKPLGEIAVGDLVISHTGAPRKVTAVHDQGVLPLVRIITKAGRTVDAALDHPFLVGRDPDVWVNAGDLRPQDPLHVVAGHWRDIAGSRSVDPDIIALSGWWHAFGTTTWAKAKLNSDLEYGNLVPLMWVPRERAKPLIELLRKMGRQFTATPVKANSGIAVRLKVGANLDLVKLLRLADVATERVVPDYVMSANRTTVIDWLSRYISERAECPKRFKTPYLLLYGRSIDFLRGVQHLLARIGVAATLEHPDDYFGGRPCLSIPTPEVAKLLGAGVVYDGYRCDEVNAIEPVGVILQRKAGAALDVIDPVHRVEHIGEGACACLTVETDHSFVVADLAVRNSTYASRLYVTWRMGRNPDLQVIGGGHGQTFVENEFSSKNRALVNSPAFQKVFPGVLIDPTMRAKGQWHIAGKKGQYVARGAGQGVHGYRANFIVIDDPYAKIEEAESPTIRGKVETWFKTDIGTRLLPGGKIFLIMTRFHEEDLTGHIIELNKSYPDDKKYSVIAIPAICYNMNTDVLKRALGQVLWDFYPISTFTGQRIELGFQRFSLVYQQSSDAVSDVAISGKFKYYTILPHRTDAAISEARAAGSVDPQSGKVVVDRQKYFRRVVVSVDTATKDTARADYTVIQVWGETHDHDHYLFDQKRLKTEFPGLVRNIEGMARRWKADRIIVEDKGNGSSYVQERGKQSYQHRRAPCPVEAIQVDSRQGKATRFDEITSYIEDGHVFLPELGAFVDGFIQEVAQFPDGNHDDQVDAMTQYLRWAKTKKSRFGPRKSAVPWSK